MRVVESVWVVFTFIPRVDFMLSTVNSRRSTVVLASLVLGGRTSRASLLSVISMVSAFIGIGFSLSSIRSCEVVATGLCVLHEQKIRSKAKVAMSRVFSFMVLLVRLCFWRGCWRVVLGVGGRLLRHRVRCRSRFRG